MDKNETRYTSIPSCERAYKVVDCEQTLSIRLYLCQNDVARNDTIETSSCIISNVGRFCPCVGFKLMNWNALPYITRESHLLRMSYGHRDARAGRASREWARGRECCSCLLVVSRFIWVCVCVRLFFFVGEGGDIETKILFVGLFISNHCSTVQLKTALFIHYWILFLSGANSEMENGDENAKNSGPIARRVMKIKVKHTRCDGRKCGG